nr:DUF1491 family protein [Sphingomonas sp.]
MEVAALLRRAAVEGGFAAVMRRGDSERGSLLLFVSCRGAHVAALERILKFDGSYRWQRIGPAESAGSAEIADFLARRARFDEDLWAVELDIADAERFIAETTLTG